MAHVDRPGPAGGPRGARDRRAVGPPGPGGRGGAGRPPRRGGDRDRVGQDVGLPAARAHLGPRGDRCTQRQGRDGAVPVPDEGPRPRPATCRRRPRPALAASGHLRRRHPRRRARLGPRPRVVRAHQPRPPPPVPAAGAPGVGVVPAGAAGRRRRRVPRVPRRVRVPRRQRAAPVAAGGGPLRRGPGRDLRVGNRRGPRGHGIPAGRGAGRGGDRGRLPPRRDTARAVGATADLLAGGSTTPPSAGPRPRRSPTCWPTSSPAAPGRSRSSGRVEARRRWRR